MTVPADWKPLMFIARCRRVHALLIGSLFSIAALTACETDRSAGDEAITRARAQIEERVRSLPVPLEKAIDDWSNAKSTDEQEVALTRIAEALAGTGLTSNVRFQTEKPGARVRYQLIARTVPVEVLESTNRSRVTDLPIGIYYVWTERDGRRTSDASRRLLITEASPPPIDIPELGS